MRRNAPVDYAAEVAAPEIVGVSAWAADIHYPQDGMYPPGAGRTSAGSTIPGRFSRLPGPPGAWPTSTPGRAVRAVDLLARGDQLPDARAAPGERRAEAPVLALLNDLARLLQRLLGCLVEHVTRPQLGPGLESGREAAHWLVAGRALTPV